jgi:putative transposase
MVSMPARNSVKTYVAEGIYHIYNRGVEKRQIFSDSRDYQMFLRCLKDALSSSASNSLSSHIKAPLQGQTLQTRLPKNFYGKIELLAYCLMPNHFHLLIRQTSSVILQQFMQSTSTRYSMYFNRRYDRIGSLFQGRYRGVLVNDEPYLLHLSRYIHLNPSEITHDLINYYSSYGEYLHIRHNSWINPEIILSFFQPGTIPFLQHINTYQDFVENYKGDAENILGSLTLDGS